MYPCVQSVFYSHLPSLRLDPYLSLLQEDILKAFPDTPPIQIAVNGYHVQSLLAKPFLPQLFSIIDGYFLQAAPSSVQIPRTIFPFHPYFHR